MHVYTPPALYIHVHIVARSDLLSLLNEDLSLQQTLSLSTSNSSGVAACLASQKSYDAVSLGRVG